MGKSKKVQHRDIDPAQLATVLERAQAALAAEDYAVLKAMGETLTFLQQELKAKGVSIERLRQILFGPKTEKTDKVFGKGKANKEAVTKEDGNGQDEEKKKGHGRNGAAAYRGAEKVKVPHPSLTAGQVCAGCQKGKVYPMEAPKVLVRITGSAPLCATVYECDRLRCNLCGEVFAAPSPRDVGEEKYDETASSMVGLLKYGTGTPFNRIEKLQRGMGIPMPAATQWELVKEAAEDVAPAHEELIRQAAQGEVLCNDDTTMKVLALTKEQRAQAAADEGTDERSGVFTSGIVATKESHHIALFFTGAQHAGENLRDVLSKREKERSPPIQMSDALAVNTAGDLKTILANCIAHARRRFVEVAEDFPSDCHYVLEQLKGVYKNDDVAKQNGMSKEERLIFHQTHSAPPMKGLEEWMKQQFLERKVEPNSGLGEAIAYMQKHWKKLTLFLHVPGAPLDNNICERALKKAILHRKNALFYKTLNGARVGDIFMSLIHTAELSEEEPFDYLVALQKHREEVEKQPAAWMPWNYRATLQGLSAPLPAP